MNLDTLVLPTDTRPVDALIKANEIDAPDDYHLYASPSQPMKVARRLIGDMFTTIDGHLLLRYWRGDWWAYSGTRWEQVEDLDVREPIWERLEEVTYIKKADEESPWDPAPDKINKLMEPLAIKTRLPTDLDAPFWATTKQRSSTVVSMNNGLFNFHTNQLEPHNPDFFTDWSLPFDYDPEATCPTWEAFLGDIFSHDPAGHHLIQEFFAYGLSGRTDLHKALLLQGPPRSGKGTISRTFKQIMGVDNVVSPSLHSLGSEFGLAELIGKPLAIIEDGRADDIRRDSSAVEKILNIVGEDAVSINRKNRDYWNGTLPTRIMLVSNEIPRFLDASGAITNRFMSVKLEKSYEENPDTTLGARINQELPGIFNWALEGMTRLNETNKFTRPATMTAMQDTMKDLASPLQIFVDEYYTITGDDDDVLALKEVSSQYRAWCESEGRNSVNQETLRQRLEALDPKITVKNTRVDGRKNRWVFGLQPLALRDFSTQS